MTKESTMSETPTSSVYRAVWRWHFYAGLLVLPILVMLALTGGTYLFAPEVAGVVDRALIEAEPGSTAPLAPSAVATSVLDATSGDVVQVVMPARPDRSVKMLVAIDGEPRTVYADPYDG